jgi:hypothetical protein
MFVVVEVVMLVLCAEDLVVVEIKTVENDVPLVSFDKVAVDNEAIPTVNVVLPL